jgi:1-pyrroline-5-carboxylate dehydrogenase
VGRSGCAGSILNLVRWVSAGVIKELFTPPADYRFPYLG